MVRNAVSGGCACEEGGGEGIAIMGGATACEVDVKASGAATMGGGSTVCEVDTGASAGRPIAGSLAAVVDVSATGGGGGGGEDDLTTAVDVCAGGACVGGV